MADAEISYTPAGETLRQFMLDSHFFRGIRGPVGSGKSVACAIECFRRASEQKPGRDGVRRSRCAIIRNTNPQLKTTTIKTWLDWFPEHYFGKFRWDPPYTHWVRHGDIELEAIFLALDRPEDVKKLLSLELTFAWINEAREIPKAIVDAITMRVDRFPSMKDGGATWAGVFADTNAPDDIHWWPIMAGDVPLPDHIAPEQALNLVKPPNWRFFNQPSGMLEVKDAHGRLTGYVASSQAENVVNLAPTYYSNLIQGKAKTWIDVYVMNRLGTLTDGKPVYQQFNRDTHVAREPIPIFDDRPVTIGIDFGLTPAAAFLQRDARGRWLLQRELVCIDMGAARFAENLKIFLARHYPENAVEAWGDPAGDQRVQTDEKTPFMMLAAKGIMARPAPSNDPVIRLSSVEAVLTRMIDGLPGILIDRSCVILIAGFEGGYHYKRKQIGGAAETYDDTPNKNRFSHPHDGLQYALLGGGEGRALVRPAGGHARPVIARREWDVFQRQAPTQRRPDKGSRWNRAS